MGMLAPRLAFCPDRQRPAEAVQDNQPPALPAWRSNRSRQAVDAELWLVTLGECLRGNSANSMTPNAASDEAMTAIETTKERWFEAEANRMAGQIALLSREPDAAKAEAYFERALVGCTQATSKIVGTPRRNEHGAALARPGQGAASARTAFSGLRLVH